MDWVGGILGLVGCFLMAKHKKTAETIFIVANVLWVAWALGNHTQSVFLFQSVLFVLNSRTLITWIKRDKGGK